MTNRKKGTSKRKQSHVKTKPAPNSKYARNALVNVWIKNQLNRPEV